MSSNDNEENIAVHFPFLSVLAIVFITLKLCNVITWSWWLILLPLYGGIAFIISILGIAALFLLIRAFISE